VKPGHVVLDLGTGSGIMALFAARAGARKVYTVEIGDYLSRASARVFAENGFAERIVPLRMDARDLTLELIEKPDVVVCEMITTGLIGEMQAPVINALKGAAIIDEHTLIVPASLDIRVTLVHVDFTFFGFQVPFPMFVDYFSREFERPYERLSPTLCLRSIDFGQPFAETLSAEAEFGISKSGEVNGLLFESSTKVADGVQLDGCISYCQPVIVPAPVHVAAEGGRIHLSLEYEMGQGFDKMRLDLRVTNRSR
jgi:predicted RNA methylase